MTSHLAIEAETEAETETEEMEQACRVSISIWDAAQPRLEQAERDGSAAKRDVIENVRIEMQNALHDRLDSCTHLTELARMAAMAARRAHNANVALQCARRAAMAACAENSPGGEYERCNALERQLEREWESVNAVACATGDRVFEQEWLDARMREQATAATAALSAL